MGRGFSEKVLPEQKELLVVRILHRNGMEPRATLLHSARADNSLDNQVRFQLIECDEGFEAALVELIEASVDAVVQWEVMSETVADLFVRVNAKVAWTDRISVNTIMELYHNVVKSRQDFKKRVLPPNVKVGDPCGLAVTIDSLIEKRGGIDDLLQEMKTYFTLLPVTDKTRKRGREDEPQRQSSRKQRKVSGIVVDDPSVGVNRRRDRKPEPKEAPKMARGTIDMVFRPKTRPPPDSEARSPETSPQKTLVMRPKQ